MTLDRRSFLAAGASALAGFDARAQTDRFADLYARARAEGELTWYIAQYRTETAEAIGKLFTELYPGVRCNVVRATGQVIYQRLTQDMKVKAHNCDVFSTTDISHDLALRKLNMLVPYKPLGLAELDPVVRAAADPDGYFTATDCNMTVLFYSSKDIKPADAPKKFADLTDPRWSGQVALAHPGFSGAMGAWVVAMDKLYGWSWFERLAKNKPHISRSLADPPVTISSGERRLGVGPASMAPAMIAKGIPIATVIPDEGAQLGFGQTALIAQSLHPNAARLFVEFQLSKPVAEMLRPLGTMPIRADITPLAGSWRPGSVKGFRTPATEVEARLPELVEKWRDTFGV